MPCLGEQPVELGNWPSEAGQSRTASPIRKGFHKDLNKRSSRRLEKTMLAAELPLADASETINWNKSHPFGESGRVWAAPCGYSLCKLF